ncbi:MAG TPA: aminoglycoside phosphotransferase family protein [Dongiaceae bacterium]
MSAFDPIAFLIEHRLLPDSGASAEALTGGYLNQVYRVRGAGVDWVVKRFMPEVELALFPNFPADEAEALKRASAHGLAPKPIGFFEEGDAPVLVYEFCPGESWRGNVADVARLLLEMRNVDSKGFRDVPMTPREILAEGDTFLAGMSAEARGRILELRPEPREMPATPRSFLHTDIGPGNIIVARDTGRLIVIDWQCPAAGDPIQDIAAFLSPAFQILYGCPPLTEDQERDFLATYDDKTATERYFVMRPYYDWRMASYCALRIEHYAVSRPKASASYAQAVNALLARLERRS